MARSWQGCGPPLRFSSDSQFGSRKQQPVCDQARGCGLQELSSLEERDSDRLRRGEAILYHHDCRRTARRSGGSLRQAVCRPSWKAAGPCFGGCRHRPERYLCDQRSKHFKWEPRGKRRIHKKPSPREIAACRPWLEAELRIIRPKTVVCLGATATFAILGPKVRVLRDRGRVSHRRWRR